MARVKQTPSQSYVTVDPAICHGKPVVAGTRVMVWQILELLEAGEGSDVIYEAFPSLPRGAIEAALRYAAQKAKSERYVSFGPYDNKAFIST